MRRERLENFCRRPVCLRSQDPAAADLGLREWSENVEDLLLSFLESRSVLIVLDNCEHLIEGCAGFADSLLRNCRHLRILATSREPLNVEGEITWRVPSLSFPDFSVLGTSAASELQRYDALSLFTKRAEMALPSFSLTEENTPAVARICSRLDGIPLAIELSAARMRVLSAAQILERLDDRFGLLHRGGVERPFPGIVLCERRWTGVMISWIVRKNPFFADCRFSPAAARWKRLSMSVRMREYQEIIPIAIRR